MSMGITAAFADPTPHSITITNTNDSISIAGKTYNAYKLFDSTHSGDAYAYYMSTSSQFYSADLLAETAPEANTLPGLLRTYFNFTAIPGDATKVAVTPKDGFDATQARTFADAIQKYLSSMAPTKSGVASGETCTINLDADEAGQGYYIVTGDAAPTDPLSTETVVSAVVITNEDPSPVVAPKAGIPTLDKKITSVNEGGSVLDAKGQAAVAKVGAQVSYELDSITPDLTGYDKYTFVIGDSISDGLTYDKTSFELKIDNATVSIAPVFAEGDKSFTLTIPFETLSNYAAGKTVVLTYKCTVNDSALQTDYENNTADLEYSHSPYDNTTNHTPEKKTYVIDLNIDVNKVAESASGKSLDGAEFQLYRLATGGAKEYYKWDDTAKKVTWVASDGDTFTTGTNGKLSQQVRGLDQGEYYLVETKAPTGYNPLASDVKVTITATANGTATAESSQVTYAATADGATIAVDNGTVDLTAAQTQAQPVATATIVNNQGHVLPSTGGIGTTIFYVVGSIMVVAAGVLLITKKRMSREG